MECKPGGLRPALGGSVFWIVPTTNIVVRPWRAVRQANNTVEFRVGFAGFQFKKPALSTDFGVNLMQHRLYPSFPLSAKARASRRAER